MIVAPPATASHCLTLEAKVLLRLLSSPGLSLTRRASGATRLLQGSSWRLASRASTACSGDIRAINQPSVKFHTTYLLCFTERRLYREG